MNERAVTAALLEDEYRHLYRTNAWFKMGFDTFVRTLPYFVAGLAQEAEAKNDSMQAALAVMESTFAAPGATRVRAR